MKRKILAADLFAGAGGATLGLYRACKEMGYELDLVAVNHWDKAIATHAKNNHYARHICATVDSVDPRVEVPGGYLDFLLAGPECIFHSRARGGKPINDQRRSSAFHIMRWLETLYIDTVIIENVPEFQDWGPLNKEGRPIKRHKGEIYQAFLANIRAFGYKVETRILCAADYGDPTTRERLFIIARKVHKPIVWPEQTHSKDGEDTLFGERQKWKPARDIIDWGLKGRSIFGRKKPLSANTLKRIAAGMKRFNGNPFLVMLYGTGTTAPLDNPLPTVTAQASHIALAEPFLIGQQSCAAPRSVDDPVPTIASAGAIGLVEPFLVTYHGATSENGHRVSSLRNPLPTLATNNQYGLVEPVMDGARLDIRYRMLQPHELAKAHSFGDYEFVGNQEDRIKQIGNSWPVSTAKALCLTTLRNWKNGKAKTK